VEVISLGLLLILAHFYFSGCCLQNICSISCLKINGNKKICLFNHKKVLKVNHGLDDFKRGTHEQQLIVLDNASENRKVKF
jgi:hypothetical protein